MSKNKQLKGYPPNYIDFNYYFYGCGDPDCPPISAELRDKMWDLSQPRIKGLGKVFISSTAGDNKWFNEIWKENEQT